MGGLRRPGSLHSYGKVRQWRAVPATLSTAGLGVGGPGASQPTFLDREGQVPPLLPGSSSLRRAASTHTCLLDVLPVLGPTGLAARWRNFAELRLSCWSSDGAPRRASDLKRFGLESSPASSPPLECPRKEAEPARNAGRPSLTPAFRPGRAWGRCFCVAAGPRRRRLILSAVVQCLEQTARDSPRNKRRPSVFGLSDRFKPPGKSSHFSMRRMQQAGTSC